jgi:hypothetical protein
MHSLYKTKDGKVCSYLEYWFSSTYIKHTDNIVAIYCRLDDKLPPIWYRFPFYKKSWDASTPRDISDTVLEYFNKYMW